MGYTHYWTLKKYKEQNYQEIEARYQRAIKECGIFIRMYNGLLKKKDDKDPGRLSGITAHSDKYLGIEFNGTGELAHETFTMPRHFSELKGFNFCKTARKPYDIVVVGCLIILHTRLYDVLEISSDGSRLEWNISKAVLETLMNKRYKMPETIQGEKLKIVG